MRVLWRVAFTTAYLSFIWPVYLRLELKQHLAMDPKKISYYFSFKLLQIIKVKQLQPTSLNHIRPWTLAANSPL